MLIRLLSSLRHRRKALEPTLPTTRVAVTAEPRALPRVRPAASTRWQSRQQLLAPRRGRRPPTADRAGAGPGSTPTSAAGGSSPPPARLFSERGFSAVSTTEIAAEAGVARGLINHYFGTKRELYVEVVREMVRVPLPPVPEYVNGADARRSGSTSRSTAGWRWSRATARPGSPRVGAEGLGRDPEIEAVLDEAREEATARLIEVLGLGPAADAPPELHAVLRAYGGMAEAATREWLERERWSREQVAAFLKAALPRLVGDRLRGDPEQTRTATKTSQARARNGNEQPDLRDRRRHDQVRQARHQGGRLPRLGQGGRREGARRRRHPLRRTSSRPTPATATATRPTGSARSTSSA